MRLFFWLVLVVVTGGCGVDCPPSAGLSQRCCPALGLDACGYGLFCAALDGRNVPTCYPRKIAGATADRATPTQESAHRSRTGSASPSAPRAPGHGPHGAAKRAGCATATTTAPTAAASPGSATPPAPGSTVRQMNRLAVYGARLAPQLASLAHIGILPPSFDGGSHPAFTRLDDSSAPVADRARAYLHSNCSQCHPGPGAKPDFLYDTNFAMAELCNEAPSSAVPGGTQLLVPGDAAHSIVALRMRDTGSYRMPRLGSARVDQVGVGVIEAWINSLTSCP